MARQTRRSPRVKKTRPRVRRAPAPKPRATRTATPSTKNRARARRAGGTRSRPSRGSRLARVTAGRFRHGTAGASTPEAENQPAGDIGDVLSSAIEEMEVIANRARRNAQSMTEGDLPGGTVVVPENDRVDAFARAFGVERSPDTPLRTSGEILDRRDRRRGGRKPPPTL